MYSFKLRSDHLDYDTTRKHRPLTKKKSHGRIPILAKNAPYQKETSILSENEQHHQEAEGQQRAIIPVLLSGKKRHSSIPIALSSISAPFPFASIFRKTLTEPKLEVKTVNKDTTKEIFSSDESMMGILDKTFQICDDKDRPFNVPEISNQFEQYSAICSNKASELLFSEEFTDFGANRTVDEHLSLPVVNLLPSTDGTALISETNIMASDNTFIKENMADSEFIMQETKKSRAAKLRKATSVGGFAIMPVANKDTGSFAIELCHKKLANFFPYIQTKQYDLRSKVDIKDNIERDVKSMLTFSSLVKMHEDCLNTKNIFKVIMISVLCLCLRLILKILKKCLNNKASGYSQASLAL